MRDEDIIKLILFGAWYKLINHPTLPYAEKQRILKEASRMTPSTPEKEVLFILKEIERWEKRQSKRVVRT